MTGTPRLSLRPALLRAYRRTAYEACGVTARIGRRCAAMDGVLLGMGTRQGGFITAWNPRSRLLPVAVNRRRQARLLAGLGRRRWRPALGTWRGWREEHLLVAADPRWLAVVGRRHGQNAIVIIRIGQRA